MNKELEEAIKILTEENSTWKKQKAIKNLRDYIDNSIPKEVIEKRIEELDEELEQMKVDNMYGRYKEYGSKAKWEKLFAQKYGMHDILQELLEGK